jgi:hypothetical protein
MNLHKILLNTTLTPGAVVAYTWRPQWPQETDQAMHHTGEYLTLDEVGYKDQYWHAHCIPHDAKLIVYTNELN